MDFWGSFSEARNSANKHYDSGVKAALDRLGLQRKSSSMDMVLPTLGIFAGGMAVGAVLGLLFAPKRGDETREEIRTRLNQIAEKTAGEVGKMGEDSTTQQPSGLH